MSEAGAALARAAERLVGSPFRFGGREPVSGLDCAGVVAAALADIGRPPAVPAGYTIRRYGVPKGLELAARNGFASVIGPTAPGDVLLVRAGPAQHHLMVASLSGGFVHAHAGLRRVVLSPPPPGWPVLRHWRLAE